MQATRMLGSQRDHDRIWDLGESLMAFCTFGGGVRQQLLLPLQKRQTTVLYVHKLFQLSFLRLLDCVVISFQELIESLSQQMGDEKLEFMTFRDIPSLGMEFVWCYFTHSHMYWQQG